MIRRPPSSTLFPSPPLFRSVAAPPAAPATPAASSSPAPSPATAAAEAKPTGSHRLVMRAIEPTWDRVQIDDGAVAEELLPTGAVRECTAARGFVPTVGNARGLEVEFHG